jgi:hypothetical protein
VQVSIGYDIIENGNGVTGNLKKKKCNFGRQGDTYAVVGRPSNLVVTWNKIRTVKKPTCSLPAVILDCVFHLIF